MPLPTLVRDSTRLYPAVFPEHETRQEAVVRRHFSWVAVAGWAWIMVILILVVGPLDAVPKLLGPFRQPVSGGGFGPIMALFAIGAVLVAFSGFVWLWVLLTRHSQEAPRPPPPPEAPPPPL